MEAWEMKEILKALESFSVKINDNMDQLKNQLNERMNSMETHMNERFDQVETRLDRVEGKMGGMRIEMNETQETVDFLSSKNTQHEKKLRKVLHEPT